MLYDKKGIIFDMGGIIFDDTKWSKWLKEKIKHHNWEDISKKWSEKKIPVYKGEKDYFDAYKEFLNEINIEDKEEFFKESLLIKKYIEESEGIFEEVEHTLKKLKDKGMKLSILTDTEHTSEKVRDRLEKWGINKFIDEVITSKDIGHVKPEREAYQKVAERLGINNEELVFVGHDEDELEGANNAGIECIVYNSKSKGNGLFIENFSDLLKIFSKKRKVRAIIQARMNSMRLPGKTLSDINGKLLIDRVIERIRSMGFVQEIIVATSNQQSDDKIEQHLKEKGIVCFRGDEKDVLDRFVQASNDLCDDDVILRITADNPLYDPIIAEKAFKIHIVGDYEYTHVEGLSHIVPEFINRGALKKLSKLVKEEFDREHVSIYMRKHPEKFNVNKLESTFSGLRPEFDKYFTIDTQEEKKFIEDMILNCSSNNQESQDILEYYKWLNNNFLKNKKNIFNIESVEVDLAGHRIGDDRPCFIVAEIGQNHNGDINIAKQLIEMASRCKADAVKFQKRDIKDEFTEKGYNAPYIGPNSFGKTYGEHREFLELTEQEHRELKIYAESKGLTYFCTACDIPSVEMMERIGNPIYKIASRDLTNLPLLKRIAETGKPIILSTGMASFREIDEALETINYPKNKVVLMQCISQYPADIENINLLGMVEMRKKYNILTGLSDHNPGIIPALSASILGAPIVEKHITLSRAMKGTDHAVALEENGLKKLVDYIRLSERAMGDGLKKIHPATDSTIRKLRRSIVTNKLVKKGDTITEDILGLKCPGDGFLWRDRNQIIGKKAKEDIGPGTTIKLEHIE